jgi:retinol-binding protein 3
MKSAVLAVSFLACATAAFAQEPKDLTIDPKWRNAILDGVAQRYDSLYVFADRGHQIRKQLTTPGVRARYADCTTASCLADKLTQDLQTWSKDKHLRLVFSVPPRPLQVTAQDTAGAQARELEAMRRRNFGFHNVERLHGNIGLLEIGRFDPAPDAAQTAAAAMAFLANTDALIIDLRNNGGGRADMVAEMMSYFVPEQTHLSTMKRRKPEDNVQIWTAAAVNGPRYLGKPIYVLTGARTFSAAEGLTYDLRHFAGAKVVGERTRGGANPGSFQQLDEHFAVFVPTGEMISEKVKANWEGVGIEPDTPTAFAQAQRTAHVSALRNLLDTKPNDPRAPMWQQAFDELKAAAN